MTSVAEDGPYSGKEVLVIALDIGSSSSAVCLSHLTPGSIPKTKIITKYEATNELKVPSVVYYDSSENKAVFFGAQGTDEFNSAIIKDRGYTKVEAFKLVLHPPSILPTTLIARELNAQDSYSDSYFEVPILPIGVTITQVYADFIRYLIANAKTQFEETVFGGAAIWTKLFSDAIIILAHPDGWNETQQKVMEDALIQADILSRGFDPSRLKYLRESEASLHWSLQQDNSDWLKPGSHFTIIDAGGSTVDTAIYRVETVSPSLTLSNAKASESIQCGGIFVTRAGQKVIENKLASSTKFSNPDIIENLVETFEIKTKRKFEGTKSSKCIMKIAGNEESDPSVGVLKGRVTLASEQVASECFDPFIDEILASARRQTRVGEFKSMNIILVGGFGESMYLKSRLKDEFQGEDIAITTSSVPSTKAVAEGCVLHYIKQLVVARAARHTFGINLVHPFNRENPEHRARQPILLADRTRGVNGGFSTIMQKHRVVSVREFTTSPYNRIITQKSELKNFEVPLYTYDGEDATVVWMQDAYGTVLKGFTLVCTIEADLSLLEKSLEKQVGAGGIDFYLVEFSIGVSFGTNSLKAKLIWKEKGVVKEGPCSIVLSALKSNENC